METLLKCFTREHEEDGEHVNCGEWISWPEMKRSLTQVPTSDGAEPMFDSLSRCGSATPQSQDSIREREFAHWKSNGEVYNYKVKGG